MNTHKRNTFTLLASAAAVAVAAAAVVVTYTAAANAKDIVKEPTTEAAKAEGTNPASPLDFTVKDIDGKDKNLADYKGSVVLMVNVASRCGNTKQYEALQSLYESKKEQGLVVI